MTAGPPDFVPENPLEQALAAAAADPLRRAAFLEALYDSEVLIPSPGPAPAADRLLSAPPGSELDLPVVDDGGRAIVPAFTSMTQLLRYVPEGTGYVQLAVRDLVYVWPDDVCLALNPRGPGVLMGPRDVRALGPQAQDYLLGQPKEEPEALLRAISSYAESTNEVVAAYRGLMQSRDPGAVPRTVVGIELEEGADRDSVFAGVTEAARVSGVPGLALVPVDRGAPGPVARYLLEQTSPFYRRGA